MKRGPSHKLKTIKKGPQTQTDQTTDTTKKNPEHMYLIFVTPLTPSVQKIVFLHGFNKFINQEI
jgi:hypothetical protein